MTCGRLKFCLVFSKPSTPTCGTDGQNSIHVNLTVKIEFGNSLWFQQSYFLFDGGF